MMHIRRHILLSLTCLGLFLSTASCRPVHHARATLATADSLLQTGCAYADSLALATAVETLRPLRLLMPNDYARACFFYGRYLRLSDRYSLAMQYLLEAHHTRTGEHVILGRTYSNMAYICRLEGNYPLSHDIYALSAEQFLLAADSLRYCNALVNTAYTLAEQGDTSAVQALLQQAAQASYMSTVSPMILETYAEAYMRAGNYPKALQYIGQMDPTAAATPSVRMIKAQCFSLMQQYDSATYYAREVLKQTGHPFLRANALYILTQQDPEARLEEVRLAAAERATILTYMADKQGDLAHAVELLQQDLNAPRWAWRNALLPAAIVLLLLALLISIRLRRKHRHALEQIASERKKADAFVMEREAQHAELQQQLTARRQQILHEVNGNIAALQHASNWQQSLGWNNYEQLCINVNKQFFFLADKLKATEVLNEKEIRLCILVFLDGFDSRQMADILCYAESGIRNYKSHTANKLGTDSRHLRQYLFSLVLGETSDKQQHKTHSKTIKIM